MCHPVLFALAELSIVAFLHFLLLLRFRPIVASLESSKGQSSRSFAPGSSAVYLVYICHIRLLFRVLRSVLAAIGVGSIEKSTEAWEFG